MGGGGCCGWKRAGREGKLKEVGGLDPTLRLARKPRQVSGSSMAWISETLYVRYDNGS